MQAAFAFNTSIVYLSGNTACPLMSTWLRRNSFHYFIWRPKYYSTETIILRVGIKAVIFILFVIILVSDFTQISRVF